MLVVRLGLLGGVVMILYGLYDVLSMMYEETID